MLPSFWRSTPEELEIQARDPKPPYGHKLPAHLIPKKEPRESPKGDSKLEANKSADNASDANKPKSKQLENEDKPPSAAHSDNDALNTDKHRDKHRGKHVTPPKTESTGTAEDSSDANKVAGQMSLPSRAPEVASPPAGVTKLGARNAPPSAEEASTAEPTPDNEPNPHNVSQNVLGTSQEEQGRQAAQLMADFTSSIPAPSGRTGPSIKAVVVGKSDPDYFTASARAFEAVDQEDDGYDEVVAVLEEEYDEEDLVACAPDEDFESDEDDEADRDAAHWERVVKGARGGKPA